MTIDRVAGAALVLIGLVTIWESRAFPLGSLHRPGPAYMPVLLAALLDPLRRGGVGDGRARPPRCRDVGWPEWRHARGDLRRPARSPRGGSSASATGSPWRWWWRSCCWSLERKGWALGLALTVGDGLGLLLPLRHPAARAAAARALRALRWLETLQNLGLGFSVALSRPASSGTASSAAWSGTLVGVLPGVGPLAGISLLLPATFGLDATSAIVMLAGIYYGAMYGGSTTSILMRIPGEAASVMTCIDGYAMARKGRAGAGAGHRRDRLLRRGHGERGRAHAAGPAAGRASRSASARRSTSRCCCSGLLVLAYMNGGSMLKALAMAALGLLLGMIGIDQMSGYFRFAYGVAELGDGIGVVPVAVGLFGLAEILLTAGQANPPAGDPPAARATSCRRARSGARRTCRSGAGPAIGFLIGIIPGSAHVISTFVSYAVERKVSKHPEEFGHGAVAGVAGPESANNAATSGAFVPMLALGVPGVPIAALLLAAMMVHGVTPGPLLIEQDPRLFWGFIASMYVGNVILLDPQPAAGRPLREPAARAVPGPVPVHPRVLDPRRLRRQQQRGRRVDHARHGRARLRAAQARLRDGADRAGAGPRAR